MSPRVLVVGQFTFLVLLLGMGALLAKFVGADFHFLLGVLGGPLLLVSTFVVLAWAVWRPNWYKGGIGLAAVLAACGLVAVEPLLSRAGDRLFFESRRDRLDDFTHEVLAFGRIQSMSDGLRNFKRLNGELVAYAPTQAGTSRTTGLRSTLPIEQVLERDEIDRRTYEAFRTRLQDLKLIEFEVHPGFVAYVYDGMLDNLEGYLYVTDNSQPPALGSELFATTLVTLRPLGRGWYWFGTT